MGAIQQDSKYFSKKQTQSIADQEKEQSQFKLNKQHSPLELNKPLDSMSSFFYNSS